MTELVVRLSAEDRAAIIRELADELEKRALMPNGFSATQAPLLSLDELAAELSRRMPARSRRQWAKYLYEHAPRGQVPGARKVASRWWFSADALETMCEGRAS